MTELVLGNGNGVDPDEDLVINKETAIKSEIRQDKDKSINCRLHQMPSQHTPEASSSDSLQPQHQF